MNQSNMLVRVILNTNKIFGSYLRGNTSVTAQIFGHFVWVEGKVVRKNALRIKFPGKFCH